MVKNFLYTLLIGGLALVSVQSKAQLSNCNAFLKGNYVQVGINWNGAYGSSTPAPAGYVTNIAGTGGGMLNVCDSILHVDSTRLGFVADPAMDGWSVGTPPFYGDFFLPGVPQEGWSIMADGSQANNWNEYTTYPVGTVWSDSASIFTGIVPVTYYDSATSTLDTLTYNAVYTHVPNHTTPGGNIAYTNSGSQVTSTWLGMYDSIAVQQVTTIDTGATYFTVQVTLTNLSSTVRNDVYYLRTVDPDNDVNQSSNFNTKNTIEAQLPNMGNNTVVSAAGTMYSAAYLAMGTNDLRAKAFFRRNNFGPDQLVPTCGTLDIIHAAIDTYDYRYGVGDTLTADVCIGLVFKIGHLASVDTLGAADSAGRKTTSSIAPNRAVISYYYAFNRNAALSISNLSNDPEIKIYPVPATNTINMSGLNSTDKVLLYDMTGRQVNGSWPAPQNGLNTFSVENVHPGIYIVVVADKNGIVRTRERIQKM